MLRFDKENYTVEDVTVLGETVRVRAWRAIPYVEKPTDPEYQRLSVFAPEEYYHRGGSIRGYRLDTAPVFMPNTVGGYMAGPLDGPGEDRHHPGTANAIFRALQHGYVVAAPAIRGRDRHTGKAPALIADHKAAVRWLHHFAADLPGDMDRIITSGTSAGGALSALMGATGDHPDYEPYHAELGAAAGSDAIFAASCYCPITDLDHADMAYEWEFLGVNDYHRRKMHMDEGGRPAFTPIDGVFTPEMERVSREEAALFPAYVNGLALRDGSGAALTLGPDGEGPFKEHIKGLILASAQRAMDRGADLSDVAWLKLEGGKAVSMDFAAYVRAITRMKEAPAFDALDAGSFENDLFYGRHFTAYSQAHSQAGGVMADEALIRLLNPLNYLSDSAAHTVRHWRIRHGERDRDTSLAVSAILTLKLREQGCQVDYHAPWDTPHAGDYDLEELFAWIDGICAGEGA